MAKRKKSKTYRRRRVGAAGKMLNPNGPLVKWGSVALGYFMGDKLNDAIEKATGDKVDGKIIGAVEAGVGLMLMTRKGKKSLPLSLVAGVLTGAGVKKSLSEFGVINGFSDVPVIAGYKSVPVLNGYTTRPGQMAGFTVPQPIHKSVMGAVCENGSGSGVTDR